MSNNNPFPLGDDEVREHFQKQKDHAVSQMGVNPGRRIVYGAHGETSYTIGKPPIDPPQRATDMPSANPWRNYTYQHSYSIQEFWSDLKRINFGLLLLSVLKIGMAVFALIGLRTVIEWMWK